MESKVKRYYTINKTFTKLQGIKNPYKAKFRECICDCGKVFNIRSERFKSVIACKECTITIKTKEKKGGLYLSVPNFSVLRRKYKGYEKRAKAKGLEFLLTIQEALELFKANCYYCGIEPQEIDAIYNSNTIDGIAKANTIDRLDSSKGYTVDNTVSCCNICNKAKLTMTETEFKQWIYRVYHHLNK